ncbi:hypothetical protein C6Y53_19670 (plasmid) [Pukyongiella litopenaei]|uniref:TrbC/VirB2 family protein n=2 Tax=Pukyongiella litopenaei TaxID=2605946 RepID=A0A5C2H712_9RHOB|nr:hypothetical protein C6Y53_19670 [Pukyongiella litopenaei]
MGRKAILVTALAAAGSAASAAGTNAGIEAGFYALGQDLDTLLAGAGGYVIMIISVIIAGIVLAFTGRWTYVGIAFGVAVFLGYGVTTLTSFGGVTASTDLLLGQTPVVQSVTR